MLNPSFFQALVALAATGPLLILSADSALNQKFTKDIKAISHRYAAEVAETERMGVEGRAIESVDRLVRLIPEEKRTAAASFWLGSLLYDLDPARSYEFHHQAYIKAPTVPMVVFEWGLQEHRAGHHAPAVDLYLKSLPASGPDARFALLADCYVRLGQPEKACAAWARVDHPNNHTGIDLAIHAVYGKPSPFMRRSKFLAVIRGGDASAWTQLIRLDASWDTNWWNSEVNEIALKADLALAKNTLEPNDFAELETLSQVLTRRDPDPEWLKALHSRGGWILDGKPLPRNTTLAARLLEWTYRKKLMSASDLVIRFKDDLWRRARSGSKEAPDALHVLAGLSLEAAQPIEDIDRFGWNELHDPSFALSLLASNGKALSSDDPDLRRALVEFPDKAEIALIAAQVAHRDKRPLKEPLLSVIRAEFTGLESDDSRYSYALKSYFRELSKSLSSK